MAATYRPQDAIDVARQIIRKMPLEEIRVRILDDVLKELWMAAPWRWTVKVAGPYDLAANTTDVTATGVSSDLLYVLGGGIYNDSGVTIWLDPEPVLSTAGRKGIPNKIAYVATDKFRITPPYGTITGNPKLLVPYKKTAPSITEDNFAAAGALVFDDEWYPVFQAGVLAKAYAYAGDQRAGSVQYVDGKVQYTGQYALFRAMIDDMKAAEPMLQNPQRIMELLADKTNG